GCNAGEPAGPDGPGGHRRRGRLGLGGRARGQELRLRQGGGCTATPLRELQPWKYASMGRVQVRIEDNRAEGVTTGRPAPTLVSLLQARPAWPVDELTRRLEVTDRTLRRDITRLRYLGYPVEATPGRHGGYRLVAGGAIPPLLLDDDEAVAVGWGLRAAASGG